MGTGTSTAVGVALALGFVDDSARATTARDITAGKAVSFTASADGSSKSEATASAAGGDKKAEGDKGKTTADDQSKSATGLGNKQAGLDGTPGKEAKQSDGGKDGKEGKKASTDDGDGGGDSVGVGAALALNIASSKADASISGVSITAVEALSLKSENNMDASAIADASAALGGAGAPITFNPTSSNVDTVTDVDNPEATDESITLASGHGLSTGDKVVYNKGANSNTAIGGLSEGGNYWVRVSGNRITLFDSEAHAEATGVDGRIDLTSVGSGTGHNFRTLSVSSGTAVGIGIAINIADMQNHANVGVGATVTAQGVSAQALMKTVGADDKTHTFAAKATSGASGGDTGVAGSFALNYSKAQTDAGLTTGLTVAAGAANVTIGAVNTTDARVEAKAKAGEAGDTGVGVSVGINIAVDNDTRAVIANGTTLDGGKNVTLSATGSHAVNTAAEGGGQSTGATGVGGALALTVADNETEARIGSNSIGLSVSGAVSATAKNTGSSITTAKGDGTGSSTAVGVALALGFVDDSASATTARDITATGALSFTASAAGSSKSEATASAKGTTAKTESDKGSKKADDQTDSAAGVASKQSGETKSVDKQQGSASTESGGVSVAASLGLNIASNTAVATVSDGLTINAGTLIVRSASLMAANAIAEGVAGTKADGDAIGVGVAINIAHENNEASVGAGATVNADGLTIDATMAGREVDFTTSLIPVVDIANDTIFVGASYGGLKTGDKVAYHNGGGGNNIGGLTSDITGITAKYSVQVVDGGKIKLRAMSEDTVGAVVNLTGGATGTDHRFVHVVDTTSVGSAASSLLKPHVQFNPTTTDHRLVNLDQGHGLRTGDAIAYESGGGAMGGLVDGNTYYVILLDDNTAELAASAQDANAGKAIVLGSNGGSSQKLIDRTSTFRAEAVAGASGGEIGVAGSVAINYAKTNTQAVVGLDHAPLGSGAVTLTLGGDDVIIHAQNLTETTVSAKPAGIASGSDTGCLLYTSPSPRD